MVRHIKDRSSRAGHDLPVAKNGTAYVATHITANPAFREWRAQGLKKHCDPMPYVLDLERTPDQIRVKIFETVSVLTISKDA